MASEDGLVRISPLTFKINVKLNQEEHLRLTITNVSPHKVAFKVKTTAPKQYLVKPTTGVVERDDAVTIAIIFTKVARFPDASNPKNLRHKFLVQTAKIEGDVSDLNEWWKRTAQLQSSSNIVYHEDKIKCKLVVPSGAEELGKVEEDDEEEGHDELASTAMSTSAFKPTNSLSSPLDRVAVSGASENRKASPLPATHSDASESKDVPSFDRRPSGTDASSSSSYSSLHAQYEKMAEEAARDKLRIQSMKESEASAKRQLDQANSQCRTLEEEKQRLVDQLKRVETQLSEMKENELRQRSVASNDHKSGDGGVSDDDDIDITEGSSVHMTGDQGGIRLQFWQLLLVIVASALIGSYLLM